MGSGSCYALTPNSVELIPTLGALFPRGGPVQDPVLTVVVEWWRVLGWGVEVPKQPTMKGGVEEVW